MIIEAIPWLLLPPACREEVLGDLRERYRSPGQYLAEAVQVVPCAVYSRICRTTDGVVALMQAGAMYTALVVAAWWLHRALFMDRRSLACLAIPPAIVVLATIVGDAYNDLGRRWPLKLWFAPATGFALACVAQLTLPAWALPVAVFAWGGVTGLLCVLTLRLVFPPVYDLPQGVSGPSYWRKLEPVPVWRNGKGALLLLFVVILYLLGK
jgi:hypothetical protein